MAGSRVRRVSGAQYVFLTLRERIISLKLAPGSRLNEVELAGELGVSRTPVREGLNRLLSEDLIEQSPTGGMFVRQLDPADLRELYSVRAVLEGVIAREACERATEADIGALGEIIERMRLLVEHAAEVFRLGDEFHGRLSDMAGNDRCEQLLRQIRGHIHRYRGLSSANEMRHRIAVEEHQEIFEAVAARDPDRAEQGMRAHIDAARDEAMVEVRNRLGKPATAPLREPPA